MSAKVLSKSYYECPNCNNPQLREVLYLSDKSVETEICTCGWPECDPDIRFEWVG